jgi:carbon-monoxide dehydrogenase small subunit
MKVQFSLNGTTVEADAAPDTLLVEIIRGLGLTGTKEACAVGVCGACTVLLDDLPVSSCIYLVACAQGADVWTVEGLTSRDGRLLDAFVEHEGMQCGICTPGQVVSAYALRLENPKADERQVRDYMSGNLCRCTGYVSVTDSVRAYLASD